MDGDFLIIGGGIAGLSAAARLAKHGRAIVLEAEDALGYHSSGRSVSFSHYGIGDPIVRGLTAWSRAFFENQPEGFCETPVAELDRSVYFATAEMLPKLALLRAEMARFTDEVAPLDEAGLLALCPMLRTGSDAAVAGLLDPTALKLDADALLQSYARQLRAAGGTIFTGRRITKVSDSGGRWTAEAEDGASWSAPILINAAGAWADGVAKLAGVRPIGLQPKRRTVIVVDPPAGVDFSGLPFVHSAASDFYMLPQSGQLLVSPVDEVEDEAGDAQPDDYDVALAAYQLEQYTTLAVTRVAHRWAGLRSFVADRVPTAGFDPQAPGFFWLVGQGGYGLQTAPAMAAAVEALATGGAWPKGLAELGALPEAVKPERLFNGSAH
ncbi:MAG TPA: FAD-binding oxidoreductase [Allosphingosinicella sp.]|jgi:D-arginine dehydrogenase